MEPSCRCKGEMKHAATIAIEEAKNGRRPAFSGERAADKRLVGHGAGRGPLGGGHRGPEVISGRSVACIGSLEG